MFQDAPGGGRIGAAGSSAATSGRWSWSDLSKVGLFRTLRRFQSMAPIEITNQRGWIGIRMSILRHEERDGTLFIMAGGLHEDAAAGVMLAYPLQWESGMWPWAGFGVHKGVITVLNPERRFDSFARVLADAYGLPRPRGLGECTAVEAMEYESDPARAPEERVELRLYFRAPDGDAVAEGVAYLVVDLKAGVLELNEREPESGKAILGQLARPA